MENSIPAIDLITTAVVRLAIYAQAPVPGGAVPGGAVPGGAVPEGAAPDAGEFNIFTSFFGNPVNLLMLAVMLFFFIVIWPQQRQAKSQKLAHEKALAAMKKNDRIITSGGIHGVIIQANSDEPVITIRIDENSGARMTVNRDAVVKVFTET